MFPNIGPWSLANKQWWNSKTCNLDLHWVREIQAKRIHRERIGRFFNVWVLTVHGNELWRYFWKLRLSYTGVEG